MTTPISNFIYGQFQRGMTAIVDASDFQWKAGSWPNHFHVLGREGAFNYFSDIIRDEALIAKVYRDASGYEIIVNND